MLLTANAFVYKIIATLAAGMFYHFKDPVMITEGRMQYLYDETGRRYLDVRALHYIFATICASAVQHPHCMYHALQVRNTQA